MMHQSVIKERAGYFIDQDAIDRVVPLVQGHLNVTYVVHGKSDGFPRLLIQRVNKEVFPDIEGVILNIRKVTDHLRNSYEFGQHAKVPTLVPARSGEWFIRDEEGYPWRAYEFLSGLEAIETAASPEEVFSGGRLCGLFLKVCRTLSPTEFSLTIPEFQNLERRFDSLREAISEGGTSRKAQASAEIRFALDHEAWAQIYGAARASPDALRICHNDLKLNNLLYRRGTKNGQEHGQSLGAQALVDLDTIMPGVLLYDFGDMVRSFVATAREDEADLSRVGVSSSLLEATVRGFAEGIGNAMTDAERRSCIQAPKALALTLGARFLTDYLNDDKYFRVHDPKQNLRRAKVQFLLAEEFAKHEPMVEQLLIK